MAIIRNRFTRSVTGRTMEQVRDRPAEGAGMNPTLETLLSETLRDLQDRRRFPESTYRVQFHTGFPFRAAAQIASYLHDLGVTHCYASPYLQARPGSTHGYDIINHNALNPEIGSEADYAAWTAALKEHALGQIVDIV